MACREKGRDGAGDRGHRHGRQLPVPVLRRVGEKRHVGAERRGRERVGAGADGNHQGQPERRQQEHEPEGS